jgi:energy-coupling factor transport system substrate-specific component
VTQPVAPAPATRASRPRFGTSTVVLIGVSIALNIVLGQLVGNVLKLPLYLDSIGTVLVGVLAGPLAGVATGVLSNVVWGLAFSTPTTIPFALTSAVIGLLAGLAGRWSLFAARRGGVGGVIVGVVGFLVGIVAAVVSAPIAFYVFGGSTGGGTDVLVAVFRGITDDVFAATLLQSGTSDPIDKTLVFLLVWSILLALPASVKLLFPQGERSI